MNKIVEIKDKQSETTKLYSQRCLNRYETVYHEFEQWRSAHNANSYSETVILNFFKHKSMSSKPSTLGAIHSGLKTMLKINKNIDISQYDEVQEFIRECHAGYIPRKAPLLSKENIKNFIENASDQVHLFNKVVIILGVTGGCTRDELLKLTTNSFNDLGTKFIITTNKNQRVLIDDTYYTVIKKYINLRPANVKTQRFFLKYCDGKCSLEIVGLGRILAVPTYIAEYLELPNPERYTGYALRRLTGLNNFQRKTVASAMENASISRMVGMNPVREKEIKQENTTKNLEKNEIIEIPAFAANNVEANSSNRPKTFILRNCIIHDLSINLEPS